MLKTIGLPISSFAANASGTSVYATASPSALSPKPALLSTSTPILVSPSIPPHSSINISPIVPLPSSAPYTPTPSNISPSTPLSNPPIPVVSPSPVSASASNYNSSLLSTPQPSPSPLYGNATTECKFTEDNKYRGSVCRETLRSCLTPGVSDIYVSSSINQEEVENTARVLTDGLEQIRASDRCKEAAMPFLCLHLFGLCDGNSTTANKLSASTCLHISTEVCTKEWQISSALVPLPVCTELPDRAPLRCNGECLIYAVGLSRCHSAPCSAQLIYHR